MDNYEFEQLKRELHHTIMKENALQKKHMEQTGRSYVISGPMPKPEPKAEFDTIFHCPDCVVDGESVPMELCEFDCCCDICGFTTQCPKCKAVFSFGLSGPIPEDC